MDTCVNLLEYNEALRTKVIQQSNAFIEDPQNRTADVVSSIQVLAAQLVALKRLEKEKLQISRGPQDECPVSLNKNFLPLARFGIEEIMRRMLKKGQSVPGPK